MNWDTAVDMYTVRNISLWDSTPDSLFDICLNYIIKDVSIICNEDPFTKCLNIKNDIILHRGICEKLLEKCQNSEIVNDRFINFFRDKGKTRLKKVKLRHSSITNEGLQHLVEHNLDELRLSYCEYLTLDALKLINEHSSSLVVLEIGINVPFFSGENSDVQKQGFVLNLPQLRQLVVRRQDYIMYPGLLVSKLPNLTHLDFSECSSLGDLSFLNRLKQLLSLTLYNVYLLQDAFEWIGGLRSLRHLDISQSNDKYGVYTNPSQILTELINNLPDLVSLDISGTNLAGTGVAAGGGSEGKPACDIPGLEQRVDRPLQFLGLYGTLHAACCRHDIPALKVTGHDNEEQIITAAIAYLSRPEILTRVLNDLYHLFRYENEKHSLVARALVVILEAMERHTLEKHIQISGSATLFYIVKGKEKSSFGIKLKQQIIKALLNGMETHLDDETMMRNGCLTLCQFKIPSDVVFEYERIVQILLFGVSDANQEGFVQRIAIYLLNSLACQVDGRQKQFLGDSGAISKMLALIYDRLNKKICDDVLEVAWSTMWNVTDETPSNCRRFLDDKGMEFFLGCLKSFPDKEELLRNMMGLLGNVAEVAELRSVFMTNNFLAVFSNLLDSFSDGIEVSYNAAGVLAHMASDGPEAWSVTDPSRQQVLQRMVTAIERWDIKAKRNINYRSFEPILSLLKAYHTPECQHWAVWALANLTSVYPEKYCSLVEAEKGTHLLADVIAHPAPYPRIKMLATCVLQNCAAYNASAAAANTN